MHRLWCKAAVKMMKTITDTKSAPKYKQAEKRATVAKFGSKKIQGPTNAEGSPTTNRQRRMHKLAARLKELNCQVSNEEEARKAGRCGSEAALKQMHQLWQNIKKDAVEEIPYAQFLEQGKW